MDDNGDAIAIWSQDYGSSVAVYSNHYSEGSGWGLAFPLDTLPFSDATRVQLAMSAGGRAVVSWQTNYAGASGIRTRHFDPRDGWADPEWVPNRTLGSSMPAVAISDSGLELHAFVEEAQPNASRAMAVWRDPLQGWSVSQYVGSAGTVGNAFPKVAIDRYGDGIAVWTDYDGWNANLRGNRFIPTYGWGSPTIIENSTTGNSWEPTLAEGADGTAFAVWQRLVGTRYDLWGSRYTIASNWGAATSLENLSNGTVGTPAVTVAAYGDAVVAWNITNGTRDDLWARRFSGATAWAAPELLSNSLPSHSSAVRTATDRAGNAIVTWSQPSGPLSSVWAIRFAETYPPTVVVLAPVNGSRVTAPMVGFQGKTEPRSTLGIGGLFVVIAMDGSFNLSVPLREGQNVIQVFASDAAGNSLILWFNLTYVNPLSAVTQDLAALQTRVGDIDAEILGLQADLLGLQYGLAEAGNATDNTAVHVSVLESRLNGSAEAVAALELTIDEVRSNLSALRRSLNETNFNLSGQGDEIGGTAQALGHLQAVMNSTGLALENASRAVNGTKGLIEATDLEIGKMQAASGAAQVAADAANARASRAEERASQASLVAELAALAAVVGIVCVLVSATRKSKRRAGYDHPTKAVSQEPPK